MFVVFLAQNIGNYQGRFEMLIKGLKKDDFEVFGYARKSPHNLSCESLKKNLQNMIDCLRHRSLMESVYVSPNSLAKSLISSRDMSNTDEKLTQMKLGHCSGSTQTLLKHLSSTEKKVCLVIVDYAALSTVPADVQALIKLVLLVQFFILLHTHTLINFTKNQGMVKKKKKKFTTPFYFTFIALSGIKSLTNKIKKIIYVINTYKDCK
ncbi:hypothetical protein BDC45DRAFT_432964 [Circinella umbellata]|nr:hypothetical protein BDC45DRAFT_432964 [Circinella umbellata]